MTPPIFPGNLLSGRIIHTVLYGTSRMTAQGNSWVPKVQGSDGVVISPKKLDSVTVISRREN